MFCGEIVEELRYVEGQIEKIATFYLVQVEDNRFAVCNLPENLKVNGLRIKLEAKPFAIPEHVQLPCTPMEFIKIY